MRPMPIERIGGGQVQRQFVSARIAAMLGFTNETIPMGTRLTREHLAMIPVNNRNCLIENRFIEVWPIEIMAGGKGAASVLEPRAAAPVPGAPASGERFVFATGFGKHTVVQGTVLGAGLSRTDAEALMASSAPTAAPAAAQGDDRKPAGKPRKPRTKRAA